MRDKHGSSHLFTPARFATYSHGRCKVPFLAPQSGMALLKALLGAKVPEAASNKDTDFEEVDRFSNPPTCTADELGPVRRCEMNRANNHSQVCNTALCKLQ